MSKLKVTVYLRSNRVVLGRQKNYDIALNSCTGACNTDVTYLINDAIQDRLLEPDSMEIVQAAQRLQGAAESMQYVDVGYFGGWLRAVLGGVWQIPTVVISGVKYRGAAKGSRALEKLSA